jgi:quercetin dioxygenase-like cupin family protein
MHDPAQQSTPYSRRLGGEESYWSLGLLQTFLAEAKDTDGRFSLGEGLAPKGAEPPPHTQTREDEAYYILEGEIILRVGGQTIEGKPGDYVWLPRGIEHSFELKTSQARALVVLTPAGLEEAFTLPPPSEEPPDVEEVVAVFNAYGVEFAPPPPQ